MKKRIAVLPGDGIGEEVMAQALRVLRAVEKKFGHQFDPHYALIGGAAFEKFEKHCPEETLEICKNSDAILFGSVGGPISEAQLPKWKGCEVNSILALRKTFNLHANFRPARIFKELAHLSPLRTDIASAGVDLVIVRELVGDVYFGKKQSFREGPTRLARDEGQYSEDQIKAVAHSAFKFAAKRRKKITSVDKANVMETSKLWREVVSEVAAEYPDITLEHILVDNCAMQLILNPAQFDVILTSNLFGDILSDEAAALVGSIGLLASASLNIDGFGLFEPPGGSAPDLAGKGIANPLGQILSVAMMLQFGFGLIEEAKSIEQAIQQTLANGFKTSDLTQAGEKSYSTSEVGDAVIRFLQN
jgi:3-isopropylmalate dehydrogenase